MKSKNKVRKVRKVTLLYPRNHVFIEDMASDPIPKNEIIRNLSLRTKLPYPLTKGKKLRYIIIQIIALVVASLLAIPLLAMMLLFPKSDVATLVAVIASLVLILAVIYIITNLKRIITTPITYITDLYESLVTRGTIVDGTMVYSSIRYNWSPEIIYVIEDGPTEYSYFTDTSNLPFIGDDLKILYLNETIHIVL